MQKSSLILGSLIGACLYGQLTIPFDWSGHSGMLINEGSLFWNRSWTSGVLLFDGTYTSFPERFGVGTSNKFKELEPGRLPSWNQLPDSNRTRSHFDYFRGDFIYDQLDLGAKYEKKNQFIYLNGFKRTFGGNTGYYLYPDGSARSPIHHSYRIDYGVKRGERQIEIGAGRFITRSGLPDSTQNGIEHDNIITGGIQLTQPLGPWMLKGYFAQFTQHRLIHHSFVPDSNYRDVNRNVLNVQIISKEGYAVGLVQQAQQVSSSIHNRPLAWSQIYGSRQWGPIRVFGGVQILNSDDALPFIWEINYAKRFGKVYLNFNTSGSPTPKHPDLDDPNDQSAFEYWARSTFRVGYDAPAFSIIGHVNLAQKDVGGSGGANILFTGGKIHYTVKKGLQVFSSVISQLDTTEYGGGIGTHMNIGLIGQMKLFKDNMKIDVKLWASGNQRRMTSFGFDPLLHKPFKHQNVDWGLPDRWLIHFEAVANISGVLVTYRINNLINALGETGDQAWAKQNHLYPPLGRLMQFGISWSFEN